MTLLRITISIVTIALLSISLYLLIALPLLQDPHEAAPAVADASVYRADSNDGGEVVAAAPLTVTDASLPPPGTGKASGSRLIEIFGSVSDADGQPVEGVLVTEERYYFATTSDALGNYRLLLELPYHRLPTLGFLRAGLRGKRIALTQAQLGPRPVYQLDVTLDDSANTLRIPGWVANDIGVALEGVRVEISSLESAAEENYYLTVFSDERGNFALEGVPGETRYKLSATLAPEYAVYRDENFYPGRQPQQLDIVLESLKFVDLEGMVQTPAGTPIANFEIYIRNESTGVHARKIVSDSSGFFTLQNFPLGKVSLTTRGAEFHKISGLELSEANYGNLVLTVAHGDRYLSGWVSDENGLPVEKAMVTLDASSRDGTVEYFSYRSQGTDANGKFSFENIAPGEQRLSVYATGFDRLELTRPFERQSEQLRLRLTRPGQ